MWSVTYVQMFRRNLPSPSSGSPFCPEEAGILVRSSGTSVSIYQSTRRRKAEDRCADTHVRTSNLTIHAALPSTSNCTVLSPVLSQVRCQARRPHGRYSYGPLSCLRRYAARLEQRRRPPAGRTATFLTSLSRQPFCKSFRTSASLKPLYR